jgi:hypothetical protein
MELKGIVCALLNNLEIANSQYLKLCSDGEMIREE